MDKKVSEKSRGEIMGYVGIAVFCLIVLVALVSDSSSSQADIANMQLEMAQKQQDSGCGNRIILGIIIIALIGIAISGSTTLANM